MDEKTKADTSETDWLMEWLIDKTKDREKGGGSGNSSEESGFGVLYYSGFCTDRTKRMKEGGVEFSFTHPFCSTQAFHKLEGTLSHWREQSALLIQRVNLLQKHPHRHTQNNAIQILWHPVAQSSWHIKLTIIGATSGWEKWGSISKKMKYPEWRGRQGTAFADFLASLCLATHSHCSSCKPQIPLPWDQPKAFSSSLCLWLISFLQEPFWARTNANSSFCTELTSSQQAWRIRMVLSADPKPT